MKRADVALEQESSTPLADVGTIVQTAREQFPSAMRDVPLL